VKILREHVFECTPCQQLNLKLNLNLNSHFNPSPSALLQEISGNDNSFPT